MGSLTGIRLHERYDRKELAELLGTKYTRYWQQGVVRVDDNYLLFVTLDKTGRPVAIRYDDRFLSPTDLQWQSQNQDSRAKRGTRYTNRGARNLGFHLFVRRGPYDADQRTARFVYLGEVRHHSWVGDNPINIRWTLDHAVPEELRHELRCAGPAEPLDRGLERVWRLVRADVSTRLYP